MLGRGAGADIEGLAGAVGGCQLQAGRGAVFAGAVIVVVQAARTGHAQQLHILQGAGGVLGPQEAGEVVGLQLHLGAAGGLIQDVAHRNAGNGRGLRCNDHGAVHILAGAVISPEFQGHGIAVLRVRHEAQVLQQVAVGVILGNVILVVVEGGVFQLGYGEFLLVGTAVIHIHIAVVGVQVLGVRKDHILEGVILVGLLEVVVEVVLVEEGLLSGHALILDVALVGAGAGGAAADLDHQGAAGLLGGGVVGGELDLHRPLGGALGRGKAQVLQSVVPVGIGAVIELVVVDVALGKCLLVSAVVVIVDRAGGGAEGIGGGEGHVLDGGGGIRLLLEELVEVRPAELHFFAGVQLVGDIALAAGGAAHADLHRAVHIAAAGIIRPELQGHGALAAAGDEAQPAEGVLAVAAVGVIELVIVDGALGEGLLVGAVIVVIDRAAAGAQRVGGRELHPAHGVVGVLLLEHLVEVRFFEVHTVVRVHLVDDGGAGSAVLVDLQGQFALHIAAGAAAGPVGKAHRPRP